MPPFARFASGGFFVGRAPFDAGPSPSVGRGHGAGAHRC